MASDGDLAALAAGLYALPPEEFTAARDAAAKELDGPARKQVKAFRRPTASAHLVNLLAREQPDLLDSLLALGPALAQAQAGGEGDALRELGRQRRELVQAVTATAVGDRDVGAATRTEVEQTLEAALADPAAADAVRSGTLVRALSFAGFGGVDVGDAVAVAAPARPAPKRGAGKTAERAPAEKPAPARTAKAEQRALDAAADLDDAVRALEQAERRLAAVAHASEEAGRARDRAQAEVDDLEAQLSAARERLAEAGHRAHDAQADADKAAQAGERARRRVADAQEAAEEARSALDALRRR